MSFAGHVYDMIRRSKQNREQLTLRRERTKERVRKMYSEKGSTLNNPNITAEEFERINREIKEHDEKKQRSYALITLAILGIAILIGLLIFILLT